MTKISNKAFLITLGLLSIIDLLFAYLLFINENTGFTRIITVGILGTISVAYLIDHYRKRSQSNSQNLTYFRAWAIGCSVVSLLFFFISSIPINHNPILPKIGDFLYVMTITLTGNAPTILVFAIFDVYILKRIGCKRQWSRASDNGGEETRPKV